MKISTDADPNCPEHWGVIDRLDCQCYIRYGNCRTSVSFEVSKRNWPHVKRVFAKELPDVEYWERAEKPRRKKRKPVQIE